MLEHFTTNSLDVTSCSPVFCCDISEEVTCVWKIGKLRFPSCQWRNSPSRARTCSLSRQWTNSTLPTGTQLRYAVSSPHSQFGNISPSHLLFLKRYSRLHFIFSSSFPNRRYSHRLFIRLVFRHMSKIPNASLPLHNSLTICVNFHSPTMKKIAHSPCVKSPNRLSPF
jgi:hypothetical protein